MGIQRSPKNLEFNTGSNWSEALSSACSSDELAAVYLSRLPTIASIVDTVVGSPDGSRVDLGDIGGGSGDIGTYLKQTCTCAPRLRVVLLDANSQAGSNNPAIDEAIICNLATTLPVKRLDLAVMRFVLNYNSREDQARIVQNVGWVLDNGSVFVNWWCGVSDEEHQKSFDAVFTTPLVSPKLLRPNAAWLTLNDTLTLFASAGFATDVKERWGVPIKDLYRIRYRLSDLENDRLLGALGRHAFISYALFVAVKEG